MIPAIHLRWETWELHQQLKVICRPVGFAFSDLPFWSPGAFIYREYFTPFIYREFIGTSRPVFGLKKKNKTPGWNDREEEVSFPDFG